MRKLFLQLWHQMWHNWAFKSISLSIAVLIWVYAGSQRATSPSRQVLAEVQAKGSAPSNLSVDLKVTTISVGVTGPAAELDRLSEGAVKAIIDIGAVTPTSRRLPVVQFIAPVSAPGVAFPDQRLSVPIDVRVNQRRTTQVTVSVQGQPPPGRAFAPARVEPESVDVVGAAVDVKRVVAVVGSVSARQGSFRGDTPLRAVDRDGITVDSVHLDPPLVTVQVDVVDSAAVKTVVVSPALIGRPAPPFTVDAITISPMTVTLAGPTAELAGITSISTAPISLEGLIADATRQVALVIPPGLSVAGSPANVTVGIRLTDTAKAAR